MYNGKNLKNCSTDYSEILILDYSLHLELYQAISISTCNLPEARDRKPPNLALRYKDSSKWKNEEYRNCVPCWKPLNYVLSMKYHLPGNQKYQLSVLRWTFESRFLPLFDIFVLSLTLYLINKLFDLYIFTGGKNLVVLDLLLLCGTDIQGII